MKKIEDIFEELEGEKKSIKELRKMTFEIDRCRIMLSRKENNDMI